MGDIGDFSLQGHRVLLVGGAGFIGHNLALEIHRLGGRAAVYDSLQVNNLGSLHDHGSAPAESSLYNLMLTERLELLKKTGVPVFVDDARDYHRVTHRVSDFEPTAVVLLAAVSHASRANKDPRATLDHSFRTLENALDASRGRVEHFVFFSSSMVYGDFSAAAVDEEAPCNPLGIYGAVKLGGEKLVTAYGQVFDLPYTIVRPSALYGQRCISRRVSQIFIENALRGRELIVKGDGTDRLDFTYIKDLVQGVCRALATERSKGEIFNLTFGDGRPLGDIADIVRREFPDSQLRHEPRDALVPERGTLDVSKAREVLGYEPAYPIERGFAEYIDWYRDLFKRFDSSALSNLEAQPNE